VTPPRDDDDEELDDDEVDDDELDTDDDDDEDWESPFEPPKPQAGRMAAHASMPAMMAGARRRSSLRSTLGFECGLGGLERASSRILGGLQRPASYFGLMGPPPYHRGRRRGVSAIGMPELSLAVPGFAGHQPGGNATVRERPADRRFGELRHHPAGNRQGEAK